MLLRRVIFSTMLVGALASVASAVTFTAETHLVLKFGVLPTGVTLGADKDKNKQVHLLGGGVADAKVNFGGNNVDRFTVDSLVLGEADNPGDGALALARGKLTFTLTNTTSSAVFIDLRLKLDQFVNVAGYGPGDLAQAISDAHSPTNGVTFGGSLLAADPSFDTDGFSGVQDFSIKVKKHDFLTFSFVARSIGAAEPVPEPSAFAALGLGAVALLRRRKK